MPAHLPTTSDLLPVRPPNRAADSGFTEAAQLLLKAGADSCASARGATPLLLAQHFKQTETAGVLEQAVLRASATALANARAAGRPPPPLPAGLHGPVISYTVDVATGKGEWLHQQGAATTVVSAEQLGLNDAPAPPPVPAQKPTGCCCIQ